MPSGAYPGYASSATVALLLTTDTGVKARISNVGFPQDTHPKVVALSDLPMASTGARRTSWALSDCGTAGSCVRQVFVVFEDPNGYTSNVLRAQVSLVTRPPALASMGTSITPTIANGNSSLTLSIRFADLVDPSSVQIAVTGASPTWTRQFPAKGRDDPASSFTYAVDSLSAFPNQGRYPITVTATDLAGNTAQLRLPVAVQIDTVAPVVGGLDITPQMIGPLGGDITIRFHLDQAPGAGALTVRAGGVDLTASCRTAGAPPEVDVTCTRKITASEAGQIQGSVLVDVEASDLAGNLTTVGGSVFFDFQPPSLIQRSLALIPGPANVLRQVEALRDGSRAQLNLSFDEALGGNPIVEAVRPGNPPLTFSCVGSSCNQPTRTSFLFEYVLGHGVAEGPYTVRVRAQDVAGNASTSTIGGASLVVDYTPPAVVPGLPNATYERATWGHTFGGATNPGYRVTVNNLSSDVAAVITYDDPDLTRAHELGRFEGGAGTGTVALGQADHTLVYLSHVDAAGNASTPQLVRRSTWIATLNGKTVGSLSPNPHRLSRVASLSPGLEQDPLVARGHQLAERDAVVGQALGRRRDHRLRRGARGAAAPRPGRHLPERRAFPDLALERGRLASSRHRRSSLRPPRLCTGGHTGCCCSGATPSRRPGSGTEAAGTRSGPARPRRLGSPTSSRTSNQSISGPLDGARPRPWPTTGIPRATHESKLGPGTVVARADTSAPAGCVFQHFSERDGEQTGTQS